MISLKKTIEAFDYRELYEAAMDSYRSTVRSLEKSTVGVDREAVNEYRSKLQELAARLDRSEVKPELLRSHAEELEAELLRYRTEIESLISGAGNDLRDVVAVLAEATESLSQRENQHGGQLSRISGGLEAIANLVDVYQIRTQLGRHVTELRTCIEQMSHENDSAMQGLQQELKGFQKRLEKVQIEASTDPLTGVANRRRAGREISTRMRERQSFGVLLFDLSRFKQINDTYGHAAGDSVLQVVAQRLQGQVRKEDLVCRWGGDEFVVVHEGRAADLRERAREIAGRVAGTVSVLLNGAEINVVVGTEVGWAEYTPGESAEQLLAKADRSLYDTKQQRPILVPALAAVPPATTIPGIPELAAAGEPEKSFEGAIRKAAVPASSPTAGKAAPLARVESPFDPATSLPRFGAAETAMTAVRENVSKYFVGCFAFRRAALVNSHYRHPATDELLPFLRDRLLTSKFCGRLFRGPGASLVVLVESPGGIKMLEEEIREVAGTGWEENLQHKRRASKLPVRVRGTVVALQEGVPEVLMRISAFLTANQSLERID